MIKQQSFTLIELLVVIVIIGILAGVIMISTSSSIDKANIAKSKVFEESIQNNLAANMVSAWDADHVTKGTTWVLNDKWGSNNGTFYDNTSTGCTTSLCPQIVNDKNMGNVLSFDGVNDYVDCGNNSSLSMGKGDQTVSFWVKFDKDVATTTTDGLIYCGGSGSNAGYRIHRGIGTDKLSAYFSDGTAAYIGTSLSADGSLISGTWYNVVVIFDRDALAYAYVDGKRQAYSFSMTSQQGNIVNAHNYEIGRSSFSYYLQGQMNSIKLYNALLTSSQIKQNYIAGLNSLLLKESISKEDYNKRINALAYE
ncbi:MAG TPA: prepilin-type N-terminal cleavage/methylation domain-containing protein [Candidatus Pacearchaeota archaeon]|nr:prepilin-type N-terminal cleavage/methylation domain-containing protein [Candidatus Pacearchaeota archaeon]